MVLIKVQFVLFALLVGLALASPTPKGKKPASHGSGSNSNSLTCKVGTGTFKFTETAAKDLAKKAPAGTSSTASGYPHEFQNLDKIHWDNSACNSKKTTTLEFPIFTDGRMYAYNKNKQSGTDAEPGDCRVVYTSTGGHYCGVMCHKSKTDKGFVKCT